MLDALKDSNGLHSSCPTNLPLCNKDTYQKLIHLAPITECIDLYGKLQLGTFDPVSTCTCLTAAYEKAILMGETIQDCMLFGESLANR